MNLTNHLLRQRSWSLKTFGPFGPDRNSGILKHLEKEIEEVRKCPSDITEWMDIVILAFHGAMNAGYSPAGIAAALETKQLKNEARVWPDYRTVPAGEPIEHVRG
ncbi:MAG: hypothetical protein UY18_C0050G0014 [Microgenomates group bacterium GW2011_GWF2_47_9]|nr:MAG: hypothetical protein UY18_C0050G0014 [Microgenomates group bacterium GW2011_GWF2_47_9]